MSALKSDGYFSFIENFNTFNDLSYQNIIVFFKFKRSVVNISFNDIDNLILLGFSLRFE